jgi:hypothetical protein
VQRTSSVSSPTRPCRTWASPSSACSPSPPGLEGRIRVIDHGITPAPCSSSSASSTPGARPTTSRRSRACRRWPRSSPGCSPS